MSSTSTDEPLKLFTPGPLNTSETVRRALGARDWGSRDGRFIGLVAGIRRRLVDIALHGGGSKDARADYTAVLLQGAGTYAVESVFANALGRRPLTAPPPSDNAPAALIVSNGAYGRRMAAICAQAGYAHRQVEMSEIDPVDVRAVEQELRKCADLDGAYLALVAIVHCETSSGIINDIHAVGQLVHRLCPGAAYFVDAMSSFGAIPLNVAESKIDFLVSSANKCLQGAPGFAYVIAKRSALSALCGNCASWSLDLVAQAAGLDATGQFRCTPPTHALAAFDAALDEFDRETLDGRRARYRRNNQVIRAGMANMGFRAIDDHLHRSQRGYIITPFHYPHDSNFDFDAFCALLSARDQIIYPGKVTDAQCFRLGNIGDLHEADCEHLVKCVREVLREMGVAVPVRYD